MEQIGGQAQGREIIFLLLNVLPCRLHLTVQSILQKFRAGASYGLRDLRMLLQSIADIWTDPARQYHNQNQKNHRKHSPHKSSVISNDGRQRYHNQYNNKQPVHNFLLLAQKPDR